jgi:hypothetical protein
VLVTPDSQTAHAVCKRFGVPRVFYVPLVHWQYDTASGVIRWYEKSSPNSDEFRGGYQSLGAALTAIQRAYAP